LGPKKISNFKITEISIEGKSYYVSKNSITLLNKVVCLHTIKKKAYLLAFGNDLRLNKYISKARKNTYCRFLNF